MTGHFFLIFRGYSDFVTQKVYFSRLMRVCIGLTMSATYFCHFYYYNLQVEYNCALIKVDWLAACFAL